MPNAGLFWSTARGTTINTELRVCDATLSPTIGDLVVMGADGEIEYAPSTPGAASQAARTLFGICANGNTGGKLNSPGYRAANTAGQDMQPYGQASFGGVGSRASTLNPANQKNIARLNKDDRFVMTRKDATAVVIGNSYGFDRVAAGDYVLDAADAQAVLRVEGFFDPDIRNNVAVPRVWVRPMFVYAED